MSLYEKRLNDYYTYTWSYVFQVFSSIACIKEQKMDGEIIIIKNPTNEKWIVVSGGEITVF